MTGALLTDFYEGWFIREAVEDFLNQVADLL